MVIEHTIFLSAGELSLSQASCTSDWQWAKHEFIKKPLDAEYPIDASAFRNSTLNSVIAREIHQLRAFLLNIVRAQSLILELLW